MPEKRGGYTFEELRDLMGVGDEVARQIWDSWGFQLPDGPEERLAHAKTGASYEHGMQELERSFRLGEITETEWQLLAQQLQRAHGL